MTLPLKRDTICQFEPKKINPEMHLLRILDAMRSTHNYKSKERAAELERRIARENEEFIQLVEMYLITKAVKK